MHVTISSKYNHSSLGVSQYRIMDEIHIYILCLSVHTQGYIEIFHTYNKIDTALFCSGIQYYEIDMNQE